MDNDAERDVSERREREARQAEVQAEVERQLKRWGLIALGAIVAAWLGWNLLWTEKYNNCTEAELFSDPDRTFQEADQAVQDCKSDAYDKIFLYPKPG